MKKKVSLILIVLTLFYMIGNVYAATTCNINISTTKTEYSKNEEIAVQVNISNIQSEKGIIAFGATLEYDKDSLTLEKIEGQNGWSNPSLNSGNGKFAMDRSEGTTNNETILKITFKVKEEAKQNLSINLKDITVADGTAPINISDTKANITIKTEDKNQTSNSEGNNTNTVQNSENNNTNSTTDSDNNNISNTQKNNVEDDNDITTSSTVLPHTGSYNISLIISVVFAIVSIVLYIKFRSI